VKMWLATLEVAKCGNRAANNLIYEVERLTTDGNGRPRQAWLA
jgi:hypothetical protein